MELMLLRWVQCRHRHDGHERRVSSVSIDSSPHSLFPVHPIGQLLCWKDGKKSLAINNIYLQGSLLVAREINRSIGDIAIHSAHGCSGQSCRDVQRSWAEARKYGL